MIDGVADEVVVRTVLEHLADREKAVIVAKAVLPEVDDRLDWQRYGSNPPDYRVGDPVRVLYDPSNPRTARLDTWGNRWGGALAGMIIGGVLLLVPAAVLVFGRVSKRTQGKKASVRKRRDQSRPGLPPSGPEPNHALRQEPPKDRPEDSTTEDRPLDTTNEHRPQDTTSKDRPQDSKNEDG